MQSVATVVVPALDMTEERVRGWPVAVHKYSFYYPVLFQAEDVAELVPPPVCCTHHDVQSRFAGLIGDSLACNFLITSLARYCLACAGLALSVSRTYIRSGGSAE